MKEQQAQARRDAEQLGHEEAARQLIGPKGGLPTLKGDLVRLVAHVSIEPNETVDKTKAKVRPLVDELKRRTPPLASKSSPPTSRATGSFPGGPMPPLPNNHRNGTWRTVWLRCSRLKSNVSRPYGPKCSSICPRCLRGQTWSGSQLRRPRMEKKRCQASLNGYRFEAAKVKRGVKQMISQAWDKHRRQQRAVSVAPARIREVMFAEEVAAYHHETFLVDFTLGKVYTDTEPVVREAARRGHQVMPSYSCDRLGFHCSGPPRHGHHCSFQVQALLPRPCFPLWWALECAATAQLGPCQAPQRKEEGAGSGPFRRPVGAPADASRAPFHFGEPGDEQCMAAFAASQIGPGSSHLRCALGSMSVWLDGS